MTIEEFINLLANFGFPIFLVIYLLSRFEVLLKEMSQAILQLEKTISQYIEKETN